MRRAAPAAVALFLLATAGCDPVSGRAPRGAPTAPTGPILLAPDGLRVGGTGLEIGFGRAQEGAVAAVSRLLGSGPSGTGRPSGCPLTTVRWSQGLTMYFRGGAFVGWRASAGRGPGFESTAGLRVGDPATGLGAAFEIRDIAGTTGPDARIATLASGEVCPA